MNAPLTAKLEERIDDITLQRVRADVSASNAGSAPESTAPAPRGKLASLFEEVVAKRFGQRQLVKLAANRGRVSAAWQDLPERMHLVANQTKLMMELVDDFRTGTYRKVPWRTLAVGLGAILYAANPADLLPDMLIGIGVLDDIAVAALAARVLRKDLVEYCRFKGYPVDDYFAPG
jgi:uncharacterized membrane protein YkvA (DUF1232 family)